MSSVDVSDVTDNSSHCLLDIVVSAKYGILTLTFAVFGGFRIFIRAFYRPMYSFNFFVLYMFE